MKKFTFAILTILSSFSYAQNKYMPVVKQGSKLTYSVITNNGAIAFVLKLDSLTSDYIKFGWLADDQSSGSWIMKKQSLESANVGFWNQPEPNTAFELQGNQSVVVISKALWNALQKDKKMSFDMKTYALKTPADNQQFKLSGKVVDALFLEAEDGSSKIWILNNPALPLMLKIEGNIAGPDAELKSIE